MRQSAEPDLLNAAQQDDQVAFGQLVAPHRAALFGYCYRLLGSTQDAEDAVQDTLLNAWRGIAGFEGRASVRTWLHRIATNLCRDRVAARPRRILTFDYGPPARPDVRIGERVLDPIWLEPCPDPAGQYERRESLELAFLLALQHLPATQRAVLVLREVLAFTAAETADVLDTTVPSVNSALQRARRTLAEHTGEPSQQQELATLPDRGAHLLTAFLDALHRADVDALVDLLTEDVRFTMPPMPFWFDGRADVITFLVDVVAKESWRRVPVHANGQLAFAAYLDRGEGHRLVAVDVLTVRAGRIRGITGFLDKATHGVFGLPPAT